MLIQRILRCNILLVVIIQFSFKEPLLLMFQGSKKNTGISFEVKYFLLLIDFESCGIEKNARRIAVTFIMSFFLRLLDERNGI